jgi:hypothetical protein
MEGTERLVFRFVAKETLGLITSEMTTIHHFNFVEEEVMKLSDPLSITLREFDDGDEITKRDTNCTR